MSKRIVQVQGIGPSLNGATRVRIVFHDMTERHFYMKADGTLFIPPGHKTDMFTTPESSKKEWDWVQKTWLKPESDAKFTPRLALPMSAQAVDLCDRLERDPHFYQNALTKKLEGDKTKPTLGKKFRETFKELKDKIQTNNTTHQPVKNVPSKGTTETKLESPIKTDGVEKKVSSPYGGCRIDKFNRKYNRPTNQQPAQ